MGRVPGVALLGLFCALCFSSAFSVEVRTAAQDSQPKYIKSGTQIAGLCVDIMKAVERIDPALTFSELNGFLALPRIEALLEEGALDAFCGLARTAQRAGKLDFIEPPNYFTHSVLAARIDDKVEIKSFDDLRKLGDEGVVLVVNRTVHVDILAAQPGIKFDASARDTSMNLRKLIEGRGRFVFQNDFALYDEIRRDRLENKLRVLPVRFEAEESARYFVVSKKMPAESRERILKALNELHQSGELARIFEVYKPH